MQFSSLSGVSSQINQVQRRFEVNFYTFTLRSKCTIAQSHEQVLHIRFQQDHDEFEGTLFLYSCPPFLTPSDLRGKI